MIALKGTYADHCNGKLPDRTLQYVCRIKLYKETYYNMVGDRTLNPTSRASAGL